MTNILEIFKTRTHTFIDKYRVHKTNSFKLFLLSLRLFILTTVSYLCWCSLNFTITWVFFLSLCLWAIYSFFVETHADGKFCPPFSPRSWCLIEVGISCNSTCNSMYSKKLYWIALLVNISILVNRVFVSKLSYLTWASSSLVSLSSSLTILNFLVMLSSFVFKSITGFSILPTFSLLSNNFS